VLVQIERVESNNKLLKKEVEKVRELLQKEAEKERELLQKEVEKERELRELAVKAAQAEVDRRILDLTFRGDYGDLRKKVEDIKESVCGFCLEYLARKMSG